MDGEVQIAVDNYDNDGNWIRKNLIKRGKTEHFGEFAMVSNVPRTANVFALKPTKLLALEKEGYDRINDTYDEALSKKFRPRTWGSDATVQIPGMARMKRLSIFDQ